MSVRTSTHSTLTVNPSSHPGAASRLAVCSWSLRPASPADLADQLLRAGVPRVQLALDPLRDGRWSPDEVQQLFAERGIEIVSGMMAMRGEDYSTLDSIRSTGGIGPDRHWDANRDAAVDNARLARRLGLDLVTFHAGFLPEDDVPARQVVIDRLRILVDIFAAESVQTAFETGQETAGTLREVMRELDRPAAGVNFDPANMILYDMGDPVQALEVLAPLVRQIHIKDACRTKVPGTWGAEVTVGQGEVDWEAFFACLTRHDLGCELVIEREAGEDRVGDIAEAARVVSSHLGAVRP